MKITPRDIARSLLDCIEKDPSLSAIDACESAIRLLKDRCPSVPLRQLVKILERELRRRGSMSSGLLVVPHEHFISADTVGALLQQKSGKTVHIERTIDPDLIGGAVLLADHRRIDCSIQGALAGLLKTCLQPLH